MFSQALFMSLPSLVLQSCKPVCNLNLILFPNLHLIWLPEIKISPSQFRAACLLTTKLSICFANHQTVLGITVRYSAISKIRILDSHLLSIKYMINLHVSIPIMRGQGVLMKVLVRKHRAVKNYIF